MLKPVLNEGYNNKDTIFFDSGYKDNIFSVLVSNLVSICNYKTYW